MADEKKDQSQNPEPPKIKLNGNGKHHTDKIPPIPAPPPKVKFETTRIKLETDQIHIPTPPAEDAPTKQSTMRINLPGSEIAETEPTVAPSSKQTSRIEIPDALTPAPATAKKTTARIELPDTVPAAPGVAKKATNRVQLPDTVSAQTPPPPVKKQTTRIDVDAASVAAAGAQVAKKTTARIELGDAVGTAKGADIGVASAHQIPRTVRIKQPDSKPTVVARKVPEIIIDTSEARKSETARIELPPETIVEQPVTRRKTIRIKRPGAEGEIPTAVRAPITVARTAAPGVARGSAAATEAEAEITVSEVAEEEVSLIATLCAIAALIIASALVYVLAAQTIAPNLPFPGKV